MIKTANIHKYIFLILLSAVVFSAVSPIFSVSASTSTSAGQAYNMAAQIKSEAVVLMDGDTGQVLFEKNMNSRMHPASITKIMTALIALEKGKLNDTVTMSYDAVWSVGRDTSHIALDEGEQITLEQALYALSIESANDAANGIAELIGGSMTDFARQMTIKAKELGALNTNFTNAHGLHDENHYTTAYDMALILSEAVKNPEFTKIFTAVIYDMPPTNKQPEARTFNRKNSLIEGPYKYDGTIAEKTGYTNDAGFTYAAAARRDGRTLVAVVMKSPDQIARWEDTAALFDYGFNEFIPVRYSAAEFAKENYIIENADGSRINADLIPVGDFNRYILKSLNKDDIEITYVFSADTNNSDSDGITGKIEGKAVFSLESGLSAYMFNELGEASLKVYFSDGKASPVSGNISDYGSQGGQGKNQEDQKTRGPVLSAIFSILSVISIILQIIGGLTVIWLILYIRRNIIVNKRRKRRLNYNNTNNTMNKNFNKKY